MEDIKQNIRFSFHDYALAAKIMESGDTVNNELRFYYASSLPTDFDHDLVLVEA